MVFFLFIFELLFATFHSCCCSFRVVHCGYWSFILRLAIFWLIFWNSKVTNFLKSTNWSIKSSSLPLILLILMSSSILTSVMYDVPFISVSLFIWCFSLLISLIFSGDFLFASYNYVCIFLIFVSKSLTLFALLVFSTFKSFLFWIFSQLKC